MTPAARKIAAEIERHGPVPFSRFMEIALYDPECGYYRAGRDPFGKEGDFYTASQLQPVFGRIAAAFVRSLRDEMGADGDFTLVEWGAGRNEMAEAFAEFRYTAVDVGRGAPPAEFSGVVFANELFDALPVDVARARDGRWREMNVGRKDEGFGWVEGDPIAGLDEPAEDGCWRERPVRMEETLLKMTAGLRRGFVFVIDYGYTARELARFPQGSLMAYHRHQARDEIFAQPGEQDLTAHVDWDALHACAERAGLSLVRHESMGRWLMRAGEKDQFAGALLASSEAEATRLRLQLKTLLVSMGESFQAAVWRREV